MAERSIDEPDRETLLPSRELEAFRSVFGSCVSWHLYERSLGAIPSRVTRGRGWGKFRLETERGAGSKYTENAPKVA